MASMSASRIVVMGVAGSGKTTVGGALAAELRVEFADADSLHPVENVAKMAAGRPLDDTDRAPWLAAVAGVLEHADGLVVACSALKRRYRDVLRAVPGVRFVFLDLDQSTAHDRAERRTDHFMGAAMITSQFDALERPDEEVEPDVVTVDATEPVDAVVRAAVAQLQERSSMRQARSAE
jgi:carbohydrate kinase (thermoresistant glucokinase family)